MEICRSPKAEGVLLRAKWFNSRLLQPLKPSLEGISLERNIAVPDCGIRVYFICLGAYLWLLKFTGTFGGSARGV